MKIRELAIISKLTSSEISLKGVLKQVGKSTSSLEGGLRRVAVENLIKTTKFNPFISMNKFSHYQIGQLIISL